jgi:hypothetical protein
MPPAEKMTDAERTQWDAITAQARRECGCAPTAAQVTHENGQVIVYTAGGHQDVSDDGDTPGEFPAAVGWSWRVAEAAWEGKRFGVTGLKRKMLRTLADHAGAVVSDRRLKLAVWGDANTETGRLRDVAFQLRALVRATFGIPVDVDPVERVEGGYRLAMPAKDVGDVAA